MSTTPPHEPEVEILPERGRRRARFSASRELARPDAVPPRASLWRRALARVPGIPTAYGLWLYLWDDNAPDLHRLLILFLILYMISPFDLANDLILPPLGFGDDFAIIFFLVRFIGSERLAPYREEARRRLRKE